MLLSVTILTQWLSQHQSLPCDTLVSPSQEPELIGHVQWRTSIMSTNAHQVPLFPEGHLQNSLLPIFRPSILHLLFRAVCHLSQIHGCCKTLAIPDKFYYLPESASHEWRTCSSTRPVLGCCLHSSSVFNCIWLSQAWARWVIDWKINEQITKQYIAYGVKVNFMC
jgi:hypothetical protein